MADLLDLSAYDGPLRSWAEQRLQTIKKQNKIPDGVDLRETLDKNIGSENASRMMRAGKIQSELNNASKDFNNLQKYINENPDTWRSFQESGGRLGQYDAVDNLKFHAGQGGTTVRDRIAAAQEQARGIPQEQPPSRALVAQGAPQTAPEATPRGLMAQGPGGGGAGGGGGGGGGGTGMVPSEPGPNITPRNMNQVGPATPPTQPKGILGTVASGAGKWMDRIGNAGLLVSAADSLAEGRQMDSEFAQRALANVPQGAPQTPPPQVDPGFSAQESMGTQTQPNFSADESMTTQMVPNPQAPQAPRGLINQQAPQAAPRVAPTELPPELAKQIGGLQKAQQERQIEQTRQQLEAGTMKGLQTGETSVSQLAQGIVQADAQRSGNTSMTPEQTAKAVTAEVATLKSMEPSDMARYVSYALIAGGLLASILDKSGRTADAFANSFNRQLDRNLAAGKMQFDQRLAMQKEAREDRKVNIDEKNVNSQIDDRAVSQKNAIRGLDQGDSRLEISRDEVGISRQKMQNDLTLGTQRNGIMAQGNSLQANNQAENRAVDRERIASQEGIAARRLAATGNKQTGTPLSFKDNQTLVKQAVSADGRRMDAALVDQVASRLGTIQKNYPGLSAQEAVKLALGELPTESVEELTFTGYKPTIRQKKSVE